MKNVFLQIKDSKSVAVAIYSSEDHDKIAQYKWRLVNGYARGWRKVGFKRESILMHRLVMNAQRCEIIDHINLKKLDNTRDNLRVVTRAQNAQNVLQKTKSSKYHGVSFETRPSSRPWVTHEHSRYKIEEHAAYSYDCYAVKKYGKGARVNGISKPIDFVPWQRRQSRRVVIDGQDAPGLIERCVGERTVIKMDVKVEGKRYHASFTSIDDAKDTYKNVLALRPVPILPLIVRDVLGRALLPCANTTGIAVDDDIYYKYVTSKWGRNTAGYPRLTTGDRSYLHRLVLGITDESILIDHINNNLLVCTRANLRIATASLNCHNRRKRKNTSSHYAGVYFDKKTRFWKVQVTKDGIRYCGKNFKDEDAAGIASNILRQKLWGMSAQLNDVNKIMMVH